MGLSRTAEVASEGDDRTGLRVFMNRLGRPKTGPELTAMERDERQRLVRRPDAGSALALRCPIVLA